MPIGDKPILEIVIRQLKWAGISSVTLATGHLAELLEAYFGNGQRFGIPIDYSREEQPLGTVGPLKLIEGLADEPFLVMNGDVLTTLSYRDLWRRHKESNAVVTIASHKRDVNVDLGVLVTDENGALTDYIEKPTYHYRVSMGIYVFSPAALAYVPEGEYFDFPSLILSLLDNGQSVGTYDFDGHWLDIGRPSDYSEAAETYHSLRDQFLPEGA
jgi:NDP-sugar pyrophosphorylase family protein